MIGQLIFFMGYSLAVYFHDLKGFLIFGVLFVIFYYLNMILPWYE